MSRWRTVVNESSSMMPTSRRRRPPTTRRTLSATCGMLHTESLEILPAEEEERAIADRLG